MLISYFSCCRSHSFGSAYTLQYKNNLFLISSHLRCNTQVGDDSNPIVWSCYCSIPLPPWVLEEISKNPDLVYTDKSGRRNPEYISLGCDDVAVLRGRTPIQVYSDFMRSFRERFKDYIGGVVVVRLLL